MNDPLDIWDGVSQNWDFMGLSEKLYRAMLDLLGNENVAEVARRARVSRSSCYRWFEGRAWPEIREAGRLAKVLKVDLAYLADDEADEPPAPAALPEDEAAALRLYRKIRDRVPDRADALGLLAELYGVVAQLSAAEAPERLNVALLERGPGPEFLVVSPKSTVPGHAVRPEDVLAPEPDSRVATSAPPRPGPPPGQEHGVGRVLGERDETEMQIRKDRERAGKAREESKSKGRGRPKR